MELVVVAAGALPRTEVSVVSTGRSLVVVVVIAVPAPWAGLLELLGPCPGARTGVLRKYGNRASSEGADTSVGRASHKELVPSSKNDPARSMCVAPLPCSSGAGRSSSQSKPDWSRDGGRRWRCSAALARRGPGRRRDRPHGRRHRPIPRRPLRVASGESHPSRMPRRAHRRLLAPNRQPCLVQQWRPTRRVMRPSFPVAWQASATPAS